MMFDNSRAIDFNRKFQMKGDDRLIDRIKITDKPGSIDIYLSDGRCVGCVPNDQLRDEIIRRFNEGASDSDVNDLREGHAELEKFLEKEGYEDLEAVSKALHYLKWLTEKTKTLSNNLGEISALSDSQLVQDVLNTIIDSLKKVTNAIDKERT
jgi:hypothetical protein